MKLRHVPPLLVREMARHASHRALVAQTLTRVIQRADELSEFMAIYWADGCAPRSGQVKKGLAAAFTKFDEYALVKTEVRSAKLLASNQEVTFRQKGRQLIFSGLPAQAPEAPVTVIVAECASVPVQDALSSIVDVT